MIFLNKDRALALITLAIVAIMFAESTSIPPRTSWQPYGSAFYPRLLLAVVAVFALLLLGRSFMPNVERQRPLLPDIATFSKTNHRVIALFVMFGIYAAILPVVGYIAATGGFLIASLALLSGLSSRRKTIATLAISVITPLMIYAVFQYGLGIRLP
jgi:putative tricarboxylic transport membrane protein